MKPLPSRFESMETLPFTEDFKIKRTGEFLKFDAGTFQDYVNQYNLFDVDDSEIPIGKYTFALKTLKVWGWKRKYSGPFASGCQYEAVNTLDVFQGNKKAACFFTDAVSIPVIRDVNSRVWMSLTPMEVITCRPAIRKMRGHVFMAGAGLGYLAQKALEKKTVKHLTLCDTNTELLRYIAERLQEKYSVTVETVCGNAYNVALNDYDSVVFDIWDSYGRANWDDQWCAVKKKLESLKIPSWGWGDVANTPSTSIWG